MSGAIMGTATLYGETVRFDVERVGGLMSVLELTRDEERWLVRDGLFEITPDEWQAWCERNVARILPALPRAQRKRLEAGLRLDQACEVPAT